MNNIINNKKIILGINKSSSPLQRSKSITQSLAMHKLSNLPTSNNVDSHGNTNITIKVSDSSANLRSKQNNNESQKVHIEQDLLDNDDVTTPFKNASDLSMSENDSKSCKLFILYTTG